ncbi:twitching motility protein PilT [alpha proteobacterium AAP81b]|nr:twitching motility protein PilT [alpha proteobacterium AAP81b]
MSQGAAIFDTSIVIDWLRDRPQAVVELGLYNQHYISRVTWMEVLAGEPALTRPHVAQLIAVFKIVEIDFRIALAAAEIRHQSRIKLLDAIILATARTQAMLLVTRNSKDFPAGTPGVRIPYQVN